MSFDTDRPSYEKLAFICSPLQEWEDYIPLPLKLRQQRLQMKKQGAVPMAAKETEWTCTIDH